MPSAATSAIARRLADQLNSPAKLGAKDIPRTWKTPPHIALIDGLLTESAAGRCRRLLLFAPPRHGKSVLTSHYFPAWFLLTHPDKRVILTSYEADFAAQWGRKVRDTINRWGPVFGVRVRTDSKAADRWELEGHGGGMQTAGAGGAILGKGADLFIVDDPVKNAEEALSPVYREKVWNWYNSTADTRLEPGARVVVTQQRWHTEDLGGRLKTEQPGDWEEVSLAALALPGDVLKRAEGRALWPERYDEAELERKRRNAPTWFRAQYQQQPLDLEGGFFKGLERIPVLPAAPTPDQFTARCRFWDLASTEAQAGADPDWTAGALVAKHRDGTFWVLDVQRARLGPQGVRSLIRQTAQADGVAVRVRIEREGGASGKLAADSIVREDLAGFSAAAVKPKGNKQERAEPFAAQVEAGNVRVVAGGWVRAWLDELRGFPTGRHDDQVDAASGGFAEVARGAAQVSVHYV
jgi:predicted phage terminase large subunit-like protein